MATNNQFKLGPNKVINGRGNLGDNTNFSDFTYVTDEDAPSGAAFEITSAGGTFETDDFIAVDATQSYRPSAQIEFAPRNLLTFDSQLDTAFVSAGTTPPSIINQVQHLSESCSAITFTAADTAGFGGSRAETDNVILAAGVYTASANLSLSRELTGSEAVTFYATGIFGFHHAIIDASNSAEFVDAFQRLKTTNNAITDVAPERIVVFLSGALQSDLTVYARQGQISAGDIPYETTIAPQASTGVQPYDADKAPNGPPILTASDFTEAASYAEQTGQTGPYPAGTRYIKPYFALNNTADGSPATTRISDVRFQQIHNRANKSFVNSDPIPMYYRRKRSHSC